MTPSDRQNPDELRARLDRAELERDRALERVRAIEAERATDWRETQHRIRNLLSVIRSIARRAGAEAETADDYRSILDGQLAAFARPQSAALHERGGAVDLAQLIADELLTMAPPAGEDVLLDGPPVRLNGQAAGLLALVLHTWFNDLFAARPLDPPGHGVSWHLENKDAEPLLRITWAPPGDGDSQSFPAAPLPSWLERAIAYDLNGTVVLVENGRPRWEIDLPLSAISPR